MRHIIVQTSPKKLVNQRSVGEVNLSRVTSFPGAEDEGIAEVDGAPRRYGAFHVYKKTTGKQQ